MNPPILDGAAGDGRVDLWWTPSEGRKWYRLRKDGKQVATKLTGITYHAVNQTNGVESVWQVVAVPFSGPVAKSNLLPLTPHASTAAQFVGRGSGATGGGPSVTHTVDTG